MSQILSALDLRYIDGKVWDLLADFTVISNELGLITVYAGEPTDFNSIPLGLREILPPDEYGEAAVLHDHVYKTGAVRGEPVTRAQADRLHREFLIYRHAPGWKVHAMFIGLRLGGWKAWGRYRRRETQPT